MLRGTDVACLDIRWKKTKDQRFRARKVKIGRRGTYDISPAQEGSASIFPSAGEGRRVEYALAKSASLLKGGPFSSND